MRQDKIVLFVCIFLAVVFSGSLLSCPYPSFNSFPACNPVVYETITLGYTIVDTGSGYIATGEEVWKIDGTEVAKTNLYAVAPGLHTVSLKIKSRKVNDATKTAWSKEVDVPINVGLPAVGMSISEDTILADGKSTSTVTANIINGCGTVVIDPRVGQHFSLSITIKQQTPADLGAKEESRTANSITIESGTKEGQVDFEGKIVCIDPNTTILPVTSIKSVVIAKYKLILSADEDIIPADGESTSNITAELTDIKGKGVQGKSINFSIENFADGDGSLPADPGNKKVTNDKGKTTDIIYTAGSNGKEISIKGEVTVDGINIIGKKAIKVWKVEVNPKEVGRRALGVFTCVILPTGIDFHVKNWKFDAEGKTNKRGPSNPNDPFLATEYIWGGWMCKGGVFKVMAKVKGVEKEFLTNLNVLNGDWSEHYNEPTHDESKFPPLFNQPRGSEIVKDGRRFIQTNLGQSVSVQPNFVYGTDNPFAIFPGTGPNANWKCIYTESYYNWNSFNGENVVFRPENIEHPFCRAQGDLGELSLSDSKYNVEVHERIAVDLLNENASHWANGRKKLNEIGLNNSLETEVFYSDSNQVYIQEKMRIKDRIINTITEVINAFIQEPNPTSVRPGITDLAYPYINERNSPAKLICNLGGTLKLTVEAGYPVTSWQSTDETVGKVQTQTGTEANVMGKNKGKCIIKAINSRGDDDYVQIEIK